LSFHRAIAALLVWLWGRTDYAGLARQNTD